MNNKLDKLFKKSNQIEISNNSKIVIMSDCHRGTGNINDNFKKNKNIYKDALKYYYKNDFIYIELGDGDEMWETKDYEKIIKENIKVFKEIKKFHDENRLIMLYGNHDIYKKNKSILEKYFYKFTNKNIEEELLNNLHVFESIILKYNNIKIFLIHGHQVDVINSTFSYLTKFIIRTLWKNIEKIVINCDTKEIKNNEAKKIIEKKLKNWSTKNNTVIISGHTHRPILPTNEESLYFNTGSCIHPNGITCIEIENENISLIKWFLNFKDNKYISVEREVIISKKIIK